MSADSAPDGRQPQTKPTELDCEVAGWMLLPSTLIIAIYDFYSAQS